MSAENLELVRRIYADWNRGDLGAATAVLAPDVEWRGHPRLPEPGPYRSRQEVERWMEQFREAWGELSVEPIELIDAGDRVVALVQTYGTGGASGVAVRGGVDVHVTEFRDGRVAAFRIYPGDYLLEHPDVSELEMELLILRVQEGLELSEAARRLGIGGAEARELLDHIASVLRDLPATEAGA